MPFVFSKANEETEIRLTACAQVTDLKAMIFGHLEENIKSQRLTWHDNIIPKDEIWLKIGGDKGGGSFKMAFEIANIKNPNSKRNTVVFSAFEAPNVAHNLKLGLQRYFRDFDDMQKEKWREWNLRVFIFGDYSFLCSLYGISGASGRHCCLWCLITQSDIQKPKAEREKSTRRTLDMLKKDFVRFQEAGSCLTKAKFFNNAIRMPLVNVPLNQVCLPGLHISLGIFNRIYVLLTEAFHKIDKFIANSLSREDVKVGSAGFQKFVSKLKISEAKRTKVMELMEEARGYENDAAYVILHESGQENNAKVVSEKAIELRQQAEELIRQLESEKISFKLEDGPCMKRLEFQLKKIGADRQAYHGGCFNGNHTDKCLKKENIKLLSSCATEICLELHLDPYIVGEAEVIQDKFRQVLTIYSNIHKAINRPKKLSELEITQLELDVHAFMKLYRAFFPEASILPKIHFLEDHIIDWVQKYKTGVGLLGEQGIESIHQEINTLKRTFSCVRNKVENIKCILQEHHRRCHPANVMKIPALKHRKRQHKQ